MTESSTEVEHLLHNLNNDLGIVVGHVELALMKGSQLPPELVRRLETVRAAALRMSEQIKAAQSKRPEKRTRSTV